MPGSGTHFNSELFSLLNVFKELLDWHGAVHSPSRFITQIFDGLEFMMQRPTHPRLHVRDARDAHTVFEAVRLGILRPIQRRLNEMERASFIQSGAIFVWEESEDDLGLKRWTDGRVWSQSRMREDPEDGTGQMPRTTSNFRFVDGINRGGHTTPALAHYDRSEQRPMGLVKQTYSAWVLLPNSKPRKWHLTAYLTYADLPHIPTVSQDPALRNISVPPGMYKSGKARSRNSDACLPTSPSPPPYAHSSMSRAASPRPDSDARTGLPSLHSTLGSYPHSGAHGARHAHDGRSMEDARMIQALNARHIM